MHRFLSASRTSEVARFVPGRPRRGSERDAAVLRQAPQDLPARQRVLVEPGSDVERQLLERGGGGEVDGLPRSHTLVCRSWIWMPPIAALGGGRRDPGACS